MKKTGFSLAEIIITMLITAMILSMGLLRVKRFEKFDKLAQASYKDLSEITGEVLIKEGGTIPSAQVYCSDMANITNPIGTVNCAVGGGTMTWPNKMQIKIYVTRGVNFVSIDLNGPNLPNVAEKDIIRFGYTNAGIITPLDRAQTLIQCKVYLDSVTTDNQAAVDTVLSTAPFTYSVDQAKALTDSFINAREGHPSLLNTPVYYGNYAQSVIAQGDLTATGVTASMDCF